MYVLINVSTVRIFQQLLVTFAENRVNDGIVLDKVYKVLTHSPSKQENKQTKSNKTHHCCSDIIALLANLSDSVGKIKTLQREFMQSRANLSLK